MAVFMKTKKKGRYKPGIKAPLSGQIRETGSQTEKTVIRGKRFPPTSAPGKTYFYVDITKHKTKPASVALRAG
jgi:hypothetical protein